MEQFEQKNIDENLRYLDLLSKKFPTISSASAEIINLNAILNLPKGTEHFISDIHGEYEAFNHVFRNCSGTIREKAIEAFQEICQFEELRLDDDKLREFCSLVYYPSGKLSQLKGAGTLTDEWYELTIKRLIVLARVVTRKYSRSKISSRLPATYAYIIQELIFKSVIYGDRDDYYDTIVDSIIKTGAADDFIIKLSGTIRALGVDHLHIVGDIYDRGKGPHQVMDVLLDNKNIDIQWGNHDILWIGAAAGNLACIANAVRICLRYANMATLDDGYGINLLPLSILALREYYNDPDLTDFMPKVTDEIPDIDEVLIARMQKAISVIQFKLEDQIIRRNPDFDMENRAIMSSITHSEDGFFATVDGACHPLKTGYLPTIDPGDPSRLTEEEERVMSLLRSSFMLSEKLRAHAEFLLSKGGFYNIFNDNLIFHAGIPLNDNLSYKDTTYLGKFHRGKDLLDKTDAAVRHSYYDDDDIDKDLFWYLWCGPDSPLFGKDRMTTFERYFIEDSSTHRESSGPFYNNYENVAMAERILEDFGLARENSHIICGHIPVKYNKGESPIKAGGRIICIDAGFSKAYHSETGQAGCTLTYNSHGMNLIMHEPFTSRENAIENGTDIISDSRFVDNTERRQYVKDTDGGKRITEDIYYLRMLLQAYRNGDIKPAKS